MVIQYAARAGARFDFQRYLNLLYYPGCCLFCRTIMPRVLQRRLVVKRRSIGEDQTNALPSSSEKDKTTAELQQAQNTRPAQGSELAEISQLKSSTKRLEDEFAF